jgi:solute carrier family 25 carnitine/acylcarnitine transporter 20/29
VGNSIVYVIGQVLELPGHTLEVAMTDLRLSTFAATSYAAEVDGRIKHAEAVTAFAPTNDAWRRLGLTLSYLLLASSRPELKRLLLYHLVNDLVYLDGNVTSSDAYLTLDDGQELFLDRFNRTTAVHGPTLAGFPANGDLRNASVVPTNEILLTSTGVLHVIDQVELPPTLDITLVKLMRGAKATTMLELLKLAGMTWVLDGTAPPTNDGEQQEEEFAIAGKRKRMQKRLFARDSYTILCPSDKAFSRLNLTHYRADLPALRELLELHVIRSPPPSFGAIKDPSRFPGEGQPLALEDEASFETLLSSHNKYGDVAFRSFGGDAYVVGVKGARGANGIDDWASVTGFGRATPRFVFDDDSVTVAEVAVGQPRMVFGGGVLAIDAVLTPYRPGWWIRWGWILVVVLLSVFAAGAQPRASPRVVPLTTRRRSAHRGPYPKSRAAAQLDQVRAARGRGGLRGAARHPYTRVCALARACTLSYVRPVATSALYRCPTYAAPRREPSTRTEDESQTALETHHRLPWRPTTATLNAPQRPACPGHARDLACARSGPGRC